uniref:(northern house mosquito) hypothetical protein n=1 Tax=Culex pipiens TaxID=7175 RepID=A0A8D8D6F0_CULPI
MEGSNGRRLSQSPADLQKQPALPVAHRPERHQPAGRRTSRSQSVPGRARADRRVPRRSGSDGPVHLAIYRQLPVRFLCARSGGHPGRSVPAASVHVSARPGIAVLSQG